MHCPILLTLTSSVTPPLFTVVKLISDTLRYLVRNQILINTKENIFQL